MSLLLIWEANIQKMILKILIAPEEMEDLEIVMTLFNGVKSFLRMKFQLKWKSKIMVIGQ